MYRDSLLTHAHVGGDAAHVHVGHLLLLDHLLKGGLAKLRVVEECGVGVHLGVDPLVDHAALGVHLQLLVQLRPPALLHAVGGPQHLGKVHIAL